MTEKEIANFIKEESKYYNNDLIKPLKLTDREFIINFSLIKLIVDEDEACKNNDSDKCINESFLHMRLVRSTDGKLKPVYVDCEKKHAHNSWIQRDYICDTKGKKLDSVQAIATEHRRDSVKNPQCNKLELIKNLLNIRDKVETKEKTRGFYIYGNFGTGKSLLLYRFCEMIQKYNLSLAFFFMPNLINKLKDSFDNDSVRPEQFLKKMVEPDVLVLDDLGSERAKDWFYNDYLINALNERMQKEKLTFFTSNKSLDDLIKKWRKDAQLDLDDAKRIKSRIKTLTGDKEFQLVDVDNRK